MVHCCIVNGCRNRTNDPKRRLDLSWHRLPHKQPELNRMKLALALPADLEAGSSKHKHARVCSECMKLKTRKSPQTRKDIPQQRHQRYTRDELRTAIHHDHSYAISTRSSGQPIHPSFLTSIANSSNVISLNNEKLTLNDDSIQRPPVSGISTVNHLSEHSEPFRIESLVDDDNAITFYTSFPTYLHFMACYNFLGEAANQLVYQMPGVSQRKVLPRGTKVLSGKNEFFLVLCRLRCGLMEQDLAYRFHISQATVSRVCIKWINFLYYKFSEIPIWPTQSQVQSMIPRQFQQQYPNTRIIIDATEVFIQRPSNPHAQQATFSTYKNHNTAKALVGITPSGAISFISPLYGGSISDRQLFVQSGLLAKLDPGDAVMADRGFNIADLLETKGIILSIPPRKTSDQLDNNELLETRRIASLRIHVERAFSRVKSFKILTCIPNNMASLSSEIFLTCAMLTNFKPPLVLKP